MLVVFQHFQLKEKEDQISTYEEQLKESQANVSTVVVESALSPEVQESIQELESYPFHLISVSLFVM